MNANNWRGARRSRGRLSRCVACWSFPLALIHPIDSVREYSSRIVDLFSNPSPPISRMQSQPWSSLREPATFSRELWTPPLIELTRALVLHSSPSPADGRADASLILSSTATRARIVRSRHANFHPEHKRWPIKQSFAPCAKTRSIRPANNSLSSTPLICGSARSLVKKQTNGCVGVGTATDPKSVELFGAVSRL